MSQLDLECGQVEEGEENSVCFSDAGSCNSYFYSTAGDGDDYNLGCGSEILEDEGDPEMGEVDFKNNGSNNNNSNFETLEIRDCRICHLSLVSSSPGNGIAIELGCSCKDDLAAAHKHCADTWFKIKGNKTCEICNSVACNVVGPNDIEVGADQQQGGGESNGGGASAAAAAAAAAAAVTPSGTETRTCLNGHRFLNFLLACMVFAFVISWLFHFNIPS